MGLEETPGRIEPIKEPPEPGSPKEPLKDPLPDRPPEEEPPKKPPAEDPPKPGDPAPMKEPPSDSPPAAARRAEVVQSGFPGATTWEVRGGDLGFGLQSVHGESA